MFARLQAAFDAQLPPDPVRYREPTKAEIVERATKVRTEWKDDEARFIETLCDALCEAKPHVQRALSSLAHQGDHAAFGTLALSVFEHAWDRNAQQRAEDELTGVA